MMLFCQDRQKLVEVGKKIDIVRSGDVFQIMNRVDNEEDTTVLAEYEKQNDAEDVLKTIFQYIRNKKESHCIPRVNEIVRI